MNYNSTAAIILAAGSSSRMGGGRHKLLLPLHDRPVLAHVLDAVLASQARPIVLVLGHQAEQVRAQIASFATHSDLSIIENTDYLQGMSTSMHLGIQTLQTNGYTKSSDKEINSTLVLLGDQPLISAQHIDTLIATYRTTGKRIIAATYEGKRGNPILFDASLFPELLEVTGDEGGRSVLERLEYSQQLSETIRYTEALASVERSLALDDTCIAAWYAKGTYLAMLARYDEALAAFDHTLAMDDTYAPAWDGMAWALGILGRRDEALAAVNRALELDPDYFDALKRKKRLETL